jgi:hypothetical protein
MPNDDVDLDVYDVKLAAQRLADCGAELLDLRRTLGASLESLGASKPWGRDELGESFSRRYDEAAARALDVFKSVAERFVEVGSQVNDAASASADTDAVTSRIIDGIL